MPRIRFSDVGRNKLTWEEDLLNIDEDALIRAIKRRGALMSNDIIVEDSKIIVGGLRVVGTTQIIQAQADEKGTAHVV